MDITSFAKELSRLFNEDPECERFMMLMHTVAKAVRKMHDSGFLHPDHNRNMQGPVDDILIPSETSAQALHEDIRRRRRMVRRHAGMVTRSQGPDHSDRVYPVRRHYADGYEPRGRTYPAALPGRVQRGVPPLPRHSSRGD